MNDKEKVRDAENGIKRERFINSGRRICVENMFLLISLYMGIVYRGTFPY